MDLNNNENLSDHTSSTITVIPSLTSNQAANSDRADQSFDDRGNTDTSRRSARHASRTPLPPPQQQQRQQRQQRRTSSIVNQSSIHRTISGGVGHGHSPKLNSRRKISTISTASGTQAHTSSQSTIEPNVNQDEDGTIDDQINAYRYIVLSDQSDEDAESTNNNTGNKQTASRVASRAEILSYFSIEPEGYKCKLCNKVYQANKRTDANLRKHLAGTVHRFTNVLFDSRLNKKTKEEPTVSAERRNELHAAAIDCIVRDGLPFGIFRKPGMAYLLNSAVPGYVGPDRKTVRQRIKALYASHLTKLRSVLPTVGPLSLTCDIWRSQQRLNFISLTCHFFDKNFAHVSIVLSCRRMSGRHVSTNIERYIEFELNRLNIKPEQVISITTDNGSDVKKATSTFKFGQPISCMAHNLNLVVQNGLCLWHEPNIKDFPLDLDADYDDMDIDDNDSFNEEYDTDIANDLLSDGESAEDDESNVDDNQVTSSLSDNEYDNDSDVETNFATLSIKDYGPSDINPYDLLMMVFHVLKKTRSSIKFIRSHNVTNEFVVKSINEKKNDNNRKVGGLVLDLSIRWNSSFLMLNRLIMHREIIMNVFSFPNNFAGLTEKKKRAFNELMIKQNEWDLLNHVRHVLEPFQVATTVLSAHHYPTMATSFFVWRLLLKFLQQGANDTPIIISLKACSRFWFQLHREKNLPQGQLEIMQAYAFLDPSIYNLLNDDDRRAAKKIIYHNLKNISAPQSSTSPSSNNSTSSTQTTTTNNALQKLAMICGHASSTCSSTTVKRMMTLDEELSAYIKAAQTATEFEVFWSTNAKILPRLSGFVRRNNIIPATSVASESLFSIAGFLNRKHRSSLSSHTLRYLLVLKNRHVIENL